MPAIKYLQEVDSLLNITSNLCYEIFNPSSFNFVNNYLNMCTA